MSIRRVDAQSPSKSGEVAEVYQASAPNMPTLSRSAYFEGELYPRANAQ